MATIIFLVLGVIMIGLMLYIKHKHDTFAQRYRQTREKYENGHTPEDQQP